jgi:hypothetical protein
MPLPRTHVRRQSPPPAYRAIGYALSIVLVMSFHIAFVERAALMLA